MGRRQRRSIEQVERDARAVELRRRNLNYRQIANELGFSSVASAHGAVQRGLADTVAETNDEVRRLELDRLDDMARAALRVLAKTHYAVSHGQVVRHPVTGEALVDDGPTLAALDRLLKIMDRRAKYLGLDAPTRVEVLTIDMIDDEISKLQQELIRNQSRLELEARAEVE
jgi:hypothetical protein